jgi:hypothetical protein
MTTVPRAPGTVPGTVLSSVCAPPYRGGTLTRHTRHSRPAGAARSRLELAARARPAQRQTRNPRDRDPEQTEGAREAGAAPDPEPPRPRSRADRGRWLARHAHRVCCL